MRFPGRFGGGTLRAGIADHPRSFFVWGAFWGGALGRSVVDRYRRPFSPPSAAACPLVDTRKAASLIKAVALYWYIRGRNPLAVAVSETRDARTAVQISGDTYAASAAGRGDPARRKADSWIFMRTPKMLCSAPALTALKPGLQPGFPSVYAGSRIRVSGNPPSRQYSE